MESLLSHFSGLIEDLAEGKNHVDQRDYEFRALLKDLAFSDTDGRYISEKMGGDAVVRINHHDDVWFFEFEMELHAGAVYLDPIYLGFDEFPVRLMATGSWDDSDRRVVLKKFEYIHQDVVRFVGDGSAILGDCIRAEAFNLEAPRFSISRGYKVYLLPFLSGFVLEESGAVGNLSMAVNWRRDRGSAIRIDLDEISFSDGRGQLEITGMSGTIHWGDAAAGTPSRLKWERLALGGMVLDAGSIEGDIRGDGFSSTKTVRVSLPGGEILIRDVNLTGLGSPDFGLSLNMVLKSVAIGHLFRDVMWVPSTGTLSADFLDVTYEKGQLVVDGDIRATIYDGYIEASALSVINPFSIFPIVNVDLEGNLSLSALTTEKHQLGAMEGRIDIQGRGLQFEVGSLVAGEFGFRSLEPDAEPHRVSTRALENLAFLFGTGGELDHWMFRVFPMWRYDRIGMSFKLDNGLLEQRGIETQGENFLITDSALPPTISMAFNNSRVDFGLLARRVSLKMTSWLTGINVATPHVSDLTTSIRGRFAEYLLKGFCSGGLGFTLDGDIALMGEETGFPNISADLPQQVELHNRETRELYTAIAFANGQPNWKQGIGEIFSKAWRNLAGPGWWVETGQGWRRNEAKTDIDPCDIATKRQHTSAVIGKGGGHG
ncbi:MAG: hypothetical protein OI74_07345 [Gammaproteobacteria bacterium (ex Lamellibrachia satsuma)]|nr:MAG: hypothetical protein OI74_07345 [Gammaproteobacteria bacterium (ex Lamellibrachia satsuma)]RRS36452.1 MAG: hypothetical protein NV67_06930 [Gammaproteobacteria bacterium (ex Lamellibrachia satsuma)]